MSEKLTLDDLLSIETDPKLWSLTCPVSGVPYWRLIRGYMMRSIASEEFYAESIFSKASRNVPKSRMISTAIRSIAYNAARSGTGTQVLIMATAVGMMNVDGRWLNRLADHFVAANPGATELIEDQFHWHWRWPRVIPPALYHMPIQARCVLQAKLEPRAHYVQIATAVIETARRRAADVIGVSIKEELAATLVQRLASRASQLPHLYRAYVSLLRSRGTKVLLKEEASYDNSAAIMAAANSLGIVTVEYQHGLISKGHDAYSFTSEVRNLASLRHCMPHYLLTYGDWWTEQTSSPAEAITIGNPHRAYSIGNLIADPGRRDVVLFLGDGLDTDASLDMARAIAETIRPMNLRLVFRPHPLERDHLAQLQLEGTAVVEVDSISDINASMAGAAAVIGETSTGLFEAVGLAARALVWDTPKARFTLGPHPLETFQSPQELAAKLAAPANPDSRRRVDHIWAPDWRQRYTTFLAEHGVTNLGDSS